MVVTKTQPSQSSVTEFLASVEDPNRRTDARTVAAMMRRATGKRAKMWGQSIVGYGSYHYRYASGREGESMLTGFSPRKQALVIYIMPGFSSFDKLMARLGQYKTGESCLYIKRLSDVDEQALEELITKSVRVMRSRYQTK
jgi:hypothetical protein